MTEEEALDEMLRRLIVPGHLDKAQTKTILEGLYEHDLMLRNRLNRLGEENGFIDHKAGLYKTIDKGRRFLEAGGFAGELKRKLEKEEREKNLYESQMQANKEMVRKLHFNNILRIIGIIVGIIGAMIGFIKLLPLLKEVLKQL